VNYDLESIWKEVVVAYFDVFPWHLSGGTEIKLRNKPQSEYLVFRLRIEPGTSRIRSRSV
jgi:hypothetical protein